MPGQAAKVVEELHARTRVHLRKAGPCGKSRPFARSASRKGGQAQGQLW